MQTPKYPLEQVALIKEKKLEEAEKILKERKIALQKEEEKLNKAQKERDEVKNHRDDKLFQLRAKLDEGTTSDKIQQMKLYLKEVDEKLRVKENKVKEQKKHVEAAEKKVEEARSIMLKCQQDVEKIQMHRHEWEKEVKLFEERKEASEMDETGSMMFSKKKRKQNRE